MPEAQKFPVMDETHVRGFLSIELSNIEELLDSTYHPYNNVVDLGIQIAADGRVWVCVNGLAVLRFTARGRYAYEEEI